jgi:hypothetical protein
MVLLTFIDDLEGHHVVAHVGPSFLGQAGQVFGVAVALVDDGDLLDTLFLEQLDRGVDLVGADDVDQESVAWIEVDELG